VVNPDIPNEVALKALRNVVSLLAPTRRLTVPITVDDLQ
jgi:hypothetical protein